MMEMATINIRECAHTPDDGQPVSPCNRKLPHSLCGSVLLSFIALQLVSINLPEGAELALVYMGER